MIMNVAEAKADIPYIKDDILVMLFFYVIVFDRSKVITVDIML